MENVIGFISGDAGCGTTMISQSVAECLRSSGKRVLLIMASGNFGDDFFINKENCSIDNIKAGIINGNLSYRELEEQFVNLEGLKILPGVINQYTTGYYPENAIKNIVELCNENFDYIILDIGNSFQKGLCISALSAAEKKYTVITQQEKTIRRYMNVSEKVLVPLNVKSSLIVNKNIKNIAFCSGKELAKIFKSESIFLVPYIEYGWQAEIERHTLLDFTKFSKAILNIAEDITSEKRERNGKRILSGRIFK